MKNFSTTAIALFAVLLNNPICNAQEVMIGYGEGALGCGKYIQERRTVNYHYDALISSWFYGFASGHNFYRGIPQLKRDVDTETVLAYLDKYCSDHPLATVSLGADELIKAFTKQK